MNIFNSNHSYIILACALLTLTPAKSDVIVKVHDGDTITTSNGTRIRLACIDAPEVKTNVHGKKDPILGPASKDWLSSVVLNQDVTVKKIATDKYGRTVARLLLKDGTDVSQLSFSTGHSKVYMAKSCPWANSFR